MRNTDSIIRRAEKQCASRGTRLTKKRKYVLTGLLESDKALSAYELIAVCKEKYDEDHSLWLKFSLTFSTILILLYFIFPSQLIEVVSRINII